MERDIDVNALAEDLRLFMDEMLFDSRLMDKLFITRYPLFILGKIQDSSLTYEYEGMSQRYFYVNNGKIISIVQHHDFLFHRHRHDYHP